MKKSITMLFALAFSLFAIAQAPQKFNYQAIARNNTGVELANQPVGIQISILDGSPNGTLVYQENHQVTTNAFGLVNLSIGGGTVSNGDFTTIAWGSGSKYIKTEIDPTGGSNYTVAGTTELISVPYALFAGQAQVGPGTANYVPKFTSTTTLGDSRIFDTGNAIGIGTNSPLFTFHIKNGFAGPTIGLQNNGTGNTANDGVILAMNTPDGEALFQTYEDQDLKLGTNGQTRIIIKNTGVVGIGTNTPTAAKLHVVSTLANSGLFETSSASTGGAVNGNNTATGGSDGVGVKGTALSANEGYGLGGLFEGNFIGARGDVNTTATFGVYGLRGEAIGASGTRYGVYGSASGGTANYGLYCNGNGGYTGTWTQVSDRKFKTNIKDMNSTLAKLMMVQPKTYDMRVDEFPSLNFAKGTQVGFVAQELETVFPELVENGAAPGVNKEDVINYKGVNYIGMVPVLTKAIQEQQLIIEDLKKQNENLSKRLDALEKK